MRAELRDWLQDGLSIVTSRVPFVVMRREHFGAQLRNAFDLGRDAGPRPRGSAPQRKATVAHLKPVKP